MKRNGFGERLKQLLKQKELTQAQVANAVGTSVPSVNRWTKGGEIEYENLRSLANFLDVNWVWLRYGDEAIESLRSISPENDTMTDMRREYLNQILDNETRMKTALEMAQIVNWEWNVLTGTLMLSDNAQTVFGCDPKTVESAMLPFASLTLESLIDQFRQEQPYSWDFHINQDTETRWFSCSARLVFDSLQRPLRVIGVSVDITARKVAEQAVERSEYLMRKIIETVPVGLWAADEHGTICLANPEVKRIWGGARYVGLDQYGQYKGWWDKNNEELGPEGWGLATAYSSGKSSAPELVNIEAFDGERRTIIMYGASLFDNKGNIIGALEINQDVTESKNTERQLKQQLEQWHAVFKQPLLAVIELNHELEITQLSDKLASQYQTPSTDKQLDAIFDRQTLGSIQDKLAAATDLGVSTFQLEGNFKNDSEEKVIYLIHNKSTETKPTTLIFCFDAIPL